MLVKWYAGALAVLAAVLVGVAAAQAAPTWHDGEKVTSKLQNACLGNIEFGALAYAGFKADAAALPGPGQVFYGHVVFGAATVVGGTGCGNSDQHAEVDLVLPSGVSLAVSASHPIYCFHEDTGGAEVKNETCPTHAINGTYGPALPPQDGSAAWDLPVGRLFEIQFPLVTTRQLRGPAGGNCPEALSELRQRNDCLVTAVHVADGDTDPWLLPSMTMVTRAGSQRLIARVAPAKGQTLGAAVRAKALLATCTLSAGGSCSVQATIPAAVARALHARVSLSAKVFVLGTGRATLGAAGSRAVRVPLSAAAARAALGRASSLRITFTLSASAPGVPKTTTRAAITLRR
jgi:hypothetical protein